jgi:hypothetical protein
LNNNLVPFWRERLLEDQSYHNQLKCRWNELRLSTLKTSTLLNWVDNQSAFLDNAQKINFATWNILHQDLLGNNYVGGSYNKEFIYYKEWLKERLNWMNDNMFGFCDIPNNNYSIFEIQAEVDPNPFNDNIRLGLEAALPTSITL